MEARGDSQFRPKVDLRKAGLLGQACRSSRRSASNRGRLVLGAVAAKSHSYLLQEISSSPAMAGPKKATTRVRCRRRSRIFS
jgi:hypothetical protein